MSLADLNAACFAADLPLAALAPVHFAGHVPPVARSELPPPRPPSTPLPPLSETSPLLPPAVPKRPAPGSRAARGAGRGASAGRGRGAGRYPGRGGRGYPGPRPSLPASGPFAPALPARRKVPPLPGGGRRRAGDRLMTVADLDKALNLDSDDDDGDDYGNGPGSTSGSGGGGNDGRKGGGAPKVDTVALLQSQLEYARQMGEEEVGTTTLRTHAHTRGFRGW